MSFCAQKVKKFLSHTWRFLRKNVVMVLRWLTQPYRDYMLRDLIKGNRVLILASGPSAADLSAKLPDDVLVFTCNTSPNLLSENRRVIDLYMCNRRVMTEEGRRDEITKLLSNFSINIFLFRRPSFIKKHTKISRYKKVLLDRSVGGRDDYYTRKIIYPHTLEEVAKAQKRKSPSTGVGLLEYALLYGASEIYLMGIDLDGAARISDREGKQYSEIHQNIDHMIIDIVSNKYGNVYVASEKSPLTAYFPYKELK